MYYFIVNPNSNRGLGEKIWRKLEDEVQDSGIEYQVQMTKARGDATALASALTEGVKDPRVIVGVGGDGTMNEILNGLSFDGPITLGYIPTGTGNDLARSLKLPRNPKQCLKKLLYPKYHKCLDYGVITYGQEELQKRRFMVSSGIGLDAAVCHQLLSGKKKHIGCHKRDGLRYIAFGIRQLLIARPVKGYLILDGVKKVEFNHIYFISSHIHPWEGGGFKFAPNADCSDGKLSVCVVHNSSKLRLIPVLIDGFIGRMGHHKGVRFYDCNEVQIHTERPMAVHVDGESCQLQTDLHLRCVEKRVRMMV